MPFTFRHFPTLLAALLIALTLGCSSSTTTANPPVSGTPPIARAQGPCDLLAAATPCVAAYSTVRALSATYTGALYRVTRKSDATAVDIPLLADGYASAATQDTFCASTTCTITKIYDQSPQHNNLTVAPPGGNAYGAGPNGYDLPAMAAALPLTAGGHKVYGIYIMPGMGYRNDTPTGIAVIGQPEGVYMVSSTLQLDGKCCFDFGNAETTNTDNGASHMDAMNLGCPATSTPCNNRAGLDMENGVYGDLSVNAGTTFATVMAANDGQSTFSIWQGDAQSGPLTTVTKSLPAGYAPMHQEGAIILGIGGDNSDGDAGYFFEGVMTAGTPTNAIMTAIQANIVTVGYSGI